MSDLWQCANVACRRRFTKAEIRKGECVCGSARFLNVQDLEHGQEEIDRLTREAKNRKRN